MSKTNQERLQDNNIELHNLKSQIDNLPEYQDIEPIYSISKIRNVPINATYLTNNTVENASTYCDNFIILSPNSVSSSSANYPKEYYFCKIENSEMIKFQTGSASNYYNDYNEIVGDDEEYIYYIYRYNGYGTSSKNMILRKINKSTNAQEEIGYNRSSYGTTHSIRYVNLNKFYVIDKYVVKFSKDLNFSKIGEITATSVPVTKNVFLNTDFVTAYIVNENNSTFTISNITLNQQCYGFSYEGDLAFCKDGKIRVMENFSISDEVIGTHNFTTYVQCVSDVFYVCNNNLYSFSRSNFSFTNMGTGKLNATYNAFFQNTTCIIFEEGTSEIGFKYNGITYYYNTEKLPDLTSSDILENKILYTRDNVQIIGTMPDNGALNYTPSTSQQTIPAGYTSGGTIAAVTSSVDSNIVAGNIKKDVEILGVTGTLEEGIDTSDATAAASDIVENKTAYVNGVKLTGTIKNTSYQNEFEANALAMDGGYNNSTVLTYELIPTNDIVIRSNNDACYVYATEDDVATAIGLTADVIKQGETVLGVTGTYEGSGEDLNETITGQENIITNLKALVNRKSEPVYDVADADVYGDTLILSDGQIEKPYTELEYVQANGNADITLDYLASSANTYIVAQYKIPQTVSNNNLLFFTQGGGGTNPSFSYYLSGGGDSASKARLTMGSNWNYYKDFTADTNIHIIKIDCENSKVIYDDTEYSITQTTWSVESNMKLLYNSANVKLYYFRIYDDGELLYDLIPCKMIETNKIGLWDLAHNVFYEGNNMIAGPEI